jgi:RNA 3'-terminal phosphate cyclase-like protein
MFYQIEIRKRGAAPKGGGAVDFTCQYVRELQPINLLDAGFIKKVRGVAFCAKVSPTILTRVIDSARGVLNNFIPDVYINADHHSGVNSGHSAGYSLSLIAESTSGMQLSVERTAEQGELPEAVGSEGALLLLQEIKNGVFLSICFDRIIFTLTSTLLGGVVDSSHQALILQLMVLCPEDVSKVYGIDLLGFTLKLSYYASFLGKARTNKPSFDWNAKDSERCVWGDI